MGYKLILWGPNARLIEESWWSSVAEAKKVARIAARHRDVFSATIVTPRGLQHRLTF